MSVIVPPLADCQKLIKDCFNRQIQIVENIPLDMQEVHSFDIIITGWINESYPTYLVFSDKKKAMIVYNALRAACHDGHLVEIS